MPRNVDSVSLLLRQCASFLAIGTGKEAHAQIVANGYLPYATLSADLLLIYSRCSDLPAARLVFNEMPVKTMHAWNIMISSYVQASLYQEALGIFSFISRSLSDLLADHYTFPALFKACAETADLLLGRWLHALATILGFGGHLLVGSSALDMYSKSGSLSEAGKIFYRLPQRDVVIWNSMISGYVRIGLSNEALALFFEMQSEGVNMDVATVPSLLGACVNDGDLIKGKEIHAQIVKFAQFYADIMIANSLIDMHAKCGSFYGSVKVFSCMETRNLVTWTTMISCSGMHGKGEESVKIFQKMLLKGFKPNSVTLTAVLASCSHLGLLEQGQKIFYSMRSVFGIEPSVKNYACMVDLLERAGQLHEALKAIQNMDVEPTSSVWGALLSACVAHKNVEFGEISACRLFELEPGNCSNYIALSSIYEAVGRRDGVLRIRSKMKKLNLTKEPGCSWINLEGNIRRFYQGSISDPKNNVLYSILNGLSRDIKVTIGETK